MAWLKKGRVVVSDVTDTCYKVVTNCVAQGGFGEVYRAAELDDHRDALRDVALKVGVDQHVWHGEAYFGHLLEDQPHVVRLRDAFPLIDGGGRARQTKYVLVFDWMEDGTVQDLLDGAARPWTEAAVLRQIGKVLNVLALLHRRGICHGDITPRNVFVDGKRLLLGDLGIARQSLTDGPVTKIGASPAIFVPKDVHPLHWSPADDVYQLGLIALSLLAGEVVTTDQVCGRALKSLQVKDSTKGWIRDALKKRRDRFRDGGEALGALRGAEVSPARSPRTLRGQRIVFTGTLPIKRDVARRRAVRAGAVVQDKVNGQTTLVVAGQPNPLMIGQRKGTKLFDAHRQIQRGQRIAIINGKRFQSLLAARR
jgi:serine/threonine protein kinase